MREPRPNSCCDAFELDRRRFLQAIGGATAAGLAGGLITPAAFAAPSTESPAEQSVIAFYQSLTDAQKELICLPLDDARRTEINANWHITDRMLGEDFFTVEQRGVVREIIRNLMSEDGHERLVKQMDEDAGGLDYFSVAVFGTPGEGQYEWALTGRHLTLRADGNSIDGAAFGGPLVYGHGMEDPSLNFYGYQTKQVNKVFQALDSPQRDVALLPNAPEESAVRLQGAEGRFPGLRVGEMTSDQQELVAETIQTLLSPYREADVEEVMAILRDNGDIADLRMAFYEQEDLNGDKEWDIWRIEGPTFVWHFRGAPHVHAYINIGTHTQNVAARQGRQRRVV